MGESHHLSGEFWYLSKQQVLSCKKKLFLEDQEIMIYNLMVLSVGLGGPTPCTAMISITKHLNSDDIKYISQILFQTGGWLTRFLPSPGLSRIDHESKMVMTPTMTTLSSVRREDQTIFSSLQQIISCERDLHWWDTTHHVISLSGLQVSVWLGVVLALEVTECRDKTRTKWQNLLMVLLSCLYFTVNMSNSK